MEMQDTINELQRELSAIGKSSARKPRSAASSAAGLAVSSPPSYTHFSPIARPDLTIAVDQALKTDSVVTASRA